MRGPFLAWSCLPALLGAALIAAPAVQARPATSPATALLATAPDAQALPVRDQTSRPQRGEASFYHDRFHGREMANGETFRQNSDSAASLTLPLGSRAQVRNLENGRTAEVTIEDRGPYAKGRVIDLSKGTARQLNMTEDGTAPVEVRPLPRNRQN